MTCDQVRRSLSAGRDSTGITEHLDGCDACVEWRGHLSDIRREAAALLPPAPAGIESRVLAAVGMRSSTAPPQPLAEPSAGVRDPFGSEPATGATVVDPGFWRPAMRKFVAGLAAAAVVMGAVVVTMRPGDPDPEFALASAYDRLAAADAPAYGFTMEGEARADFRPEGARPAPVTNLTPTVPEAPAELRLPEFDLTLPLPPGAPAPPGGMAGGFAEMGEGFADVGAALGGMVSGLAEGFAGMAQGMAETQLRAVEGMLQGYLGGMRAFCSGMPPDVRAECLLDLSAEGAAISGGMEVDLGALDAELAAMRAELAAAQAGLRAEIEAYQTEVRGAMETHREEYEAYRRSLQEQLAGFGIDLRLSIERLAGATIDYTPPTMRLRYRADGRAEGTTRSEARVRYDVTEPVTTSDRVEVVDDGERTYVRDPEQDGDWREVEPSQEFAVTAIAEIRGVPDVLALLQRVRGEIERLGESEIDGERARGYRFTAEGGYQVEAWLARADGLPRRIEVIEERSGDAVHSGATLTVHLRDFVEDPQQAIQAPAPSDLPPDALLPGVRLRGQAVLPHAEVEVGIEVGG